MPDDRTIISLEERKYATPVKDFKKPILEALNELQEGDGKTIFELVKNKFILLKEPYDYYFYGDRNEKPKIQVAKNRHSWGLVILQREKKIKKIGVNPNRYKLIK